MKKKPTILSFMTKHMVELYSISNRPYASNAFGVPKSEANFYTFVPKKNKDADKIKDLLSELNLQKLGVFGSDLYPKKLVIIAPYTAYRSLMQRAALGAILRAYDRMDALEKLAQNGGFELSPAESEYFAKKVKTR